MISVMLNQNEYLSSKSFCQITEIPALLAFKSLTLFTMNSFIFPLPTLHHRKHVKSNALFSARVCVEFFLWWVMGAEKEYPMTDWQRICDPAAAVQQPSPSGEHTNRSPDTCVQKQNADLAQTKGLCCISLSWVKHSISKIIKSLIKKKSIQHIPAYSV